MSSIILKPSRREVMALVAGFVAAITARPAYAQEWPGGVVKIIMGFAAGSSSDAFARMTAKALQEKYGQPFVVENHPGAGGWIGTAQVANAKTDGHMFTVNANGICVLGAVRKNDFDATKNLTPIAMIAQSPVALLIPASLPVKTVKEFVSYANAHPGELFFGSAGVGSINHLYGELFNIRAGTKVIHVPYNGMAEALPDLGAGRVHLAFSSIASGKALIDSGKVRLLAYGSDLRTEGTPDGESVSASGIDYTENFWWALFGEPGIAPGLQKEINAATNEGLSKPEYAKLFAASSVIPTPLSVEDFTVEVNRQSTELQEVIKAANITF